MLSVVLDISILLIFSVSIDVTVVVTVTIIIYVDVNVDSTVVNAVTTPHISKLSTRVRQV